MSFPSLLFCYSSFSFYVKLFITDDKYRLTGCCEMIEYLKFCIKLRSDWNFFILCSASLLNFFLLDLKIVVKGLLKRRIFDKNRVECIILKISMLVQKLLNHFWIEAAREKGVLGALIVTMTTEC